MTENFPVILNVTPKRTQVGSVFGLSREGAVLRRGKSCVSVCSYTTLLDQCQEAQTEAKGKNNFCLHEIEKLAHMSFSDAFLNEKLLNSPVSFVVFLYSAIRPNVISHKQLKRFV